MSAPVPRRILMSADTVGGVWTYSLELCRALAVHGVEVVLATMGPPLGLAQRAAVAAVDNVIVRESSYKLEWMPDPWPEVDQAGQWLLELAAELQPDVVHLCSYSHAALPWGLPVVLVGHSCVLSWWRAVKGDDPPPELDEYRHRVGEGLIAADMVVAPSQAMLDALGRHYRTPSPTRVIYNGRSEADFSATSGEPLILTAGRIWDQAKNIAALAACAESLPWPVYVAGPTDEPMADSMPESPDQLLPELPGAFTGGPETRPAGAPGPAMDHEYRPAPDGLGGNLRCLGAMPPAELARWMARAAIVALPARYEPFGLTALEAALSCCALVLGDIPSLREVWGDAAVFVPPDDSHALGRVITGLIRDHALRNDMARRAHARARRYTPERMASEYLDVYRALLAPRVPT